MDEMTETELNRLRKELADKYRGFQKELAKLEKDAKKEDGLFDRGKKRAQANAKIASLKELMEATSKFQKAIEPGSTKTVSEQVAAYNNLKNLEDKLNYKSSNCKYSINTPILNTLKTHHNRSIKKNVEKPFLTFLKKTGIAVLPLVAIPLFPAIGLGAAGAALATPLAWLGAGLVGRSIYHTVQGFIRKTIVKQEQKKDKSVTYDSMYPTQSNSKGFFRTLAYNRLMKRTAGDMYSSLNQLDEYKTFKGAKIAPIKSDETTTEEEKTEEKTKEKTEEKTEEKETSVIKDFIREVSKADITKLEEVIRLDDKLHHLMADAKEEENDYLILTMDYLKAAEMLHKKVVDAELARLLIGITKADAAKGESYESLRGIYAKKLENLCTVFW